MDETIKKCFEKWARIGNPNNNLSEAYIKMSRKDLIALRSLPIEISGWKAATAYYARYHMLSALLSKVGIFCKDHNCSISIAEFMFNDIDKKLFQDLKRAKRQRINLQYYADRPVSEKDLKRNIEGVEFFVGAISRYIESLTREKIEKTRGKLK